MNRVDFGIFAGIVLGTQVATVQIMFNSLQPVLPELPRLLHAAHNYSLIVELVLEFLSTCAHQMLVFLSQVKCLSLLSNDLIPNLLLFRFNSINLRRIN